MFDILPWYPGPCALQLHPKKLLPDDGHITSFFLNTLACFAVTIIIHQLCMCTHPECLVICLYRYGFITFENQEDADRILKKEVSVEVSVI